MFSSNPNKINLSKLDKSVGLNGANKRIDVLVVQRLLNACKVKYDGKMPVVADGLYGRKTCEQIKLFQKEVLKFSHPDGLIQSKKIRISVYYLVLMQIFSGKKVPLQPITKK